MEYLALRCIETSNDQQFEANLISELQPIRQFVLAISVYHILRTGIYETLSEEGPMTASALSSKLSLDPDRLDGFLKYLRNENLLVEKRGAYDLSGKCQTLATYKAWYEMLIGGYAETFLQIGNRLKIGSESCTRNAALVGSGSCGISHFDAIPLTRSLMNEVEGGCHRLLDLGCGNGAYLAEFCKALPHIMACGVEPDEGGFREAQNLIEKAGLSHRVQIRHADAVSFLDSDFEFDPDFIVLGFVLHEILGQLGRNGVVNFLEKIIKRFPTINIIVIEVDDKIDDPATMKHGLALAYYNPYYLLHYFTRQKLAPDIVWHEIFHDAGLRVKKKYTTCQNVDSTHLEIGYLLAISN
ncbi:2-ketoarginine methyltransferase [Paraburkholderia sp. Ac-20340]|uniref:2-ketoarginine methyltransferase n=1 Tax=Paraburkholderia sp. Ac-20340 TaxID=2703888 RepID=UPI00197ED304|nr:2-ketoarginine methyltransferase [Paraburkholderia sp. Ac-20340]MBN3855653.1 2-ketoarginine methyltransferase [Paraburkholderia sp. Ac-20340]